MSDSSTGGNALALKPPSIVIALAIAGLASGVVMLVWTTVNFERLTTFGVFLMPLATALFLFGGLDALQRRYVVEESQVHMRILFMWKTRRLPNNITIKTNRYGQLILRDRVTNRVVLRIPREYNRNDSLGRRLNQLLATRNVGS